MNENAEAKEKRKAIYDEILELLCKSEMAARNGQWMTCGTWAKNAMTLAYEKGNAENDDK